MANTYDELKAEVQLWLDNNNPNVVAAIPSFIVDAEKRLSRLLETVEQQCHTATLLTPPRAANAPPPGSFNIPSNLASIQALYRDGTYLWIHYLKKIPPLSEYNQTNWLIDTWPDLYRYQALISSEGFTKNDERIPVWKAASDEILFEVEQLAQRQMYGGSDLVSRTPDRTTSSSEKQQIKVLPLWDFVNLPASTSSAVSSCGDSGDAYYCVAGDRIMIWPLPAAAEE